MGQLLSQLTQRHDSVQIFLDFDSKCVFIWLPKFFFKDAVPSPKEQDLWNEIHLVCLFCRLYLKNLFFPLDSSNWSSNIRPIKSILWL